MKNDTLLGPQKLTKLAKPNTSHLRSDTKNNTEKRRVNSENVSSIGTNKMDVAFRMFFLQLYFLLGVGIERNHKIMSPSLQFDPEKQQNDTAPNDTSEAHIAIFRKMGTHVGLELDLVDFAMAGAAQCKTYSTYIYIYI